MHSKSQFHLHHHPDWDRNLQLSPVPRTKSISINEHRYPIPTHPPYPESHSLCGPVHLSLCFFCTFAHKSIACSFPPSNPLALFAALLTVEVVPPQARKTTKMTKKTMSTRNILIMSQRLEETDWKYLRISPWAISTFSSVSSTLASIL